MQKAYVLLLLMMSLLGASCRHTRNVTCKPLDTQLDIASFVAGDLSPAPIVIRYKQDNAFDSVIDTVITSPEYSGTRDTVGLIPVAAGYDYKVVFPADTLTYTITDLTAAGLQEVMETYGDAGPQPCYNQAMMCSINRLSRPVQFPSATEQAWFQPGFIILVK